MSLYQAELTRTFTSRRLWLMALVGWGLSGFGGMAMWYGKTITNQADAQQVSDFAMAGILAIYSVVCAFLGGHTVTHDFRSGWMRHMRRAAQGDLHSMAIKLAAIATFSLVTSDIADAVALGTATISAPIGYTVSPTAPLFLSVLGSLLCCLSMSWLGCAVGFILKRWVPTAILLFAFLIGTLGLKGTPMGQYISFDVLAASLTFDPTVVIKLSFGWALLDTIGICVVFSLLAIAFVGVRGVRGRSSRSPGAPIGPVDRL